jgi:c-di-GMP-binding flagellar brake protein YcgR
MHDWRQYKRERYDGTVDITVSIIKSNALEKVSFNAETVDISQGGIGIVLDVPLENGFVKLNRTGDVKAGTVMWNRKLDDNKYRVGIRFNNMFTVNSLCPSEFYSG